MSFHTGNVSTAFNKMITTVENLVQGDGGTLVFTNLQISKVPIFVGTFKLRYTVSTTVYTVTASSTGVITGTHIGSGSVTEAGVINVTFTTAPGNLSWIQAFEYKTKGIVEKLMDYAKGAKYEETVGTGNGVLVTFGVTLTNTPVALGQLRVRFQIGAVEKEVWSDGEGGFNAHTDVDAANSTIDEATGVLSIKFNTAIDTGYVIKALYCVANSYGNDWLVFREENTKLPAGTDAFSGLHLREWIVKNSSVSYKDFSCIGLRECQYLTGTAWNVNMNWYTKWDKAYETATCPWIANSGFTGMSTYNTTYNQFTIPTFYLKDDSLKYWFYISKRRIIIVVRVTNTVYASAYLGGVRRLSSPSKYKYPYIVIGNNNAVMNYSSTSLVGIFGAGNTYWFTAKPITDLVQLPGSTPNGKIIPTQDRTNADGTMTKTRNSEVLLYPAYTYIVGSTGPLDSMALGEIDGTFLCIDKDLSTEDTITIGADTYTVFQNIYRTTYMDYMAVKQE